MSWIRKPTELEIELAILGFECVKGLGALIFRHRNAMPDDDLEKNLAGIIAADEQHGSAASDAYIKNSNNKSMFSTAGLHGSRPPVDTITEVHGVTCYCCYFPGQYDRHGSKTSPVTTTTAVINTCTYVKGDFSYDAFYKDEPSTIVSVTIDPDRGGRFCCTKCCHCVGKGSAKGKGNDKGDKGDNDKGCCCAVCCSKSCRRVCDCGELRLYWDENLSCWLSSIRDPSSL